MTSLHSCLPGDDPLAGKPALLLIGVYSRGLQKYSGPSAEIGDRLEAGGYRVFRASFCRGRLTRAFDRMCAVVRRHRQYDVALVDVYSGPAFLWAEAVCWALKQVRKPSILTLHGGNLPAFAKQWPGRVRRLLRSGRVVTSPSPYLKETMKAFRDDILIIPNAIEPTLYEFRPRENPSPRIVWLRAFNAIYNPSLALKVIALLAHEFPRIRLTMFGPDKGDGSLQQCEETARELGVADRIDCPGAVPKRELSKHLNSGDVFINTTNVDNTPVSVIEALACGLCVVSTDVGGIPYFLHHEQDALLVPPNDAQAMAAAVRRVLLEPELSRRLSYAGRDLAEAFHWSAVLPRWERLINDVALRHRKRQP